jgi:hypothetical protein
MDIIIWIAGTLFVVVGCGTIGGYAYVWWRDGVSPAEIFEGAEAAAIRASKRKKKLQTPRPIVTD